ncbi:Zinc finger, RING-type [Sesbania bispinosa]|nr:Zinc finger, RING-type [Sesbania bispinosa]
MEPGAIEEESMEVFQQLTALPGFWNKWGVRMSTESAEREAVVSSPCDVGDDLEDVVSSSNGVVIGDLGVLSSTMLARLDLSLACFSEKVSNLNIFAMHLATMESYFETLVNDHMRLDSFEKVVEFDLLSGVLESEVRELDGFLDTLQAGIAEARERVCSCNHLGKAFITMQDKLLDTEQYLKQSEEQFTEIKIQSSNFQRTLSSLMKAENGNGEAGEIVKEGDKSLNVNAEIKLQTIEQQRCVLRMLEKSLAREMDLENNLYDSREIQEKLKLRMFSLEQELVHMEEEAIDVWERWFEADNASEILMGISKGLLGRLQISQFNLNGSSHREFELRAKLETLVEQLRARDITMDKIESSTAQLNGSLLGQTNEAKDNLKNAEDKLIIANSEVSTLKDRVSLLEKQLKESESQLLNAKSSADEYQKQYNVVCSEVRDMGNLIVELKETVCNAKSRADSAEAKCKLLIETNSKLNEELTLRGDMSMRVDLLERQLKESNLQLQNTVASAEASLEKQSMLYSTISDMKNVIKDLKSKASKAESRADSAEENCIILSESNAELNEELSFLRNRLECLEGSLHREEEAKIATAKDIGKQTKFFKNLVTQLAIERERLKQQVIEKKKMWIGKNTYSSGLRDPEVMMLFGVASGFEEEEPGEEALRYLEWEILLAVNNLERNAGLEHDDENFADSYLAIQDGYISTSDYDILFGQFLENESALKGSPPAAKSFVENLPLVELTEEELRGKEVACAICKDEIMLEEKVRRLPCSHCYHGDCILPWLSIRNTCPVCRFELPTDDPDYEQI